MSRRVSLPGADELFRPTKPLPEPDRPANGSAPSAVVEPARAKPSEPQPAERKTASGRVKHDEKITVYVTADELLDLEHARLLLRRDHGLAVDRGRIVREALHLALAGVEADGADSALVRRLREQ
jgi:hypothetical protein